jgi:hypothetical protein
MRRVYRTLAVLTEEELVYIDRSYREGKTRREIASALGYGNLVTFDAAVRGKGYKRGACLVRGESGEALSGESGEGKYISSREEREYFKVLESFKGRKRATVEVVARLLRLILSYVDNYLKEYPISRDGRER